MSDSARQPSLWRRTMTFADRLLSRLRKLGHPSSNGAGSPAHLGTGADLGSGEPGRFPFQGSGYRAATPSTVEPQDDTPDPTAEEGVHAITKKTNYWFERQVHALEQRTVVEAENWARAGLPLAEAARSEPLDIESVLAGHARQIFRDWAERVRTKMKDAIASGTREFGEQVNQLRKKVARLDEVAQDLQAREEKIERIRNETSRDTGPVQYLPMISGWLFWPMAVLLVLVEFAANFPVFRLLLPMESALATAARNAIENVDDASWLAGLQLFGRSLTMHFEAFVVAMVAVTALVLLGKQLGASMRPLLALRPREHPLAASSIRGFLRQHTAILVLCFLGAAAVLGFLYTARGSIADTADARVAQDSIRRIGLEQRLQSAQQRGDRAAIATLAIESQMFSDVEERHRDDAAYARTVESNNRSILLLNLGLVLVAAVLGFTYTSYNLDDRRGEHPDLSKLREKCAALRLDRIGALEEARQALGKTVVLEGAVRHLAEAKPLAAWDSKAKRLNALIPLFRAENARLRGLDPATVRAFEIPCPLNLESPVSSDGFPLPGEFERFIQDRNELATRLEEHRLSAAPPREGALQ